MSHRIIGWKERDLLSATTYFPPCINKTIYIGYVDKERIGLSQIVKRLKIRNTLVPCVSILLHLHLRKRNSLFLKSFCTLRTWNIREKIVSLARVRAIDTNCNADQYVLSK